MTPAEFAFHVRFMTRTNASTFTDAQIMSLMKIRQKEISADILDADEDIFLMPQYTSLVANQRDYTFPTDMLASIKRVEAKLDGINYIPLHELDISNVGISISDEASIIQTFSNEKGRAFFDIIRKSLNIYSGTITSVADGLKVMVNTYPAVIADLTSTTDMSIDPTSTTHGMPLELHEIWARAVIIDYKSSKEKPIPLTERELSYKVDKIAAINALKPQNRDREVIATVPTDDGSSY